MKNRAYYENQCSAIVGPCNEAIRRTCSNNEFAELYEVVALATVLKCEVRSVYPYIDYRAEMKCMNAVYKPIGTLSPTKTRLVIFWTSSEDEIMTRARPNSGGLWSPNHFVPLLQPSHIHRTRKAQIDATEKV